MKRGLGGRPSAALFLGALLGLLVGPGSWAAQASVRPQDRPVSAYDTTGMPVVADAAVYSGQAWASTFTAGAGGKVSKVTLFGYRELAQCPSCLPLEVSIHDVDRGTGAPGRELGRVSVAHDAMPLFSEPRSQLFYDTTGWQVRLAKGHKYALVVYSDASEPSEIYTWGLASGTAPRAWYRPTPTGAWTQDANGIVANRSEGVLRVEVG